MDNLNLFQSENNENQPLVPSTSSVDTNITKNKTTYFPKQVYLIIANEICERFTYYGIHTILVIYLTNAFLISKHNAVIIYHIFNMVAYLSPIGGAILSDSYIGRYKTILYLSVVYSIGSFILAATSTPKAVDIFQLGGPLVGLTLIAVGTGGIKPCVSAFGADQFEPEDKHKIETYFSVFYFSINMGSLISMIVTPLLRSDIQCFGDDCYLAAFGVPSLLMILSIILFLAGSRLYKKALPDNNIIMIVFNITIVALKEKIKNFRKQSKNSHWLDLAKKHYSDQQLITDVKALYRVLFLFLPLPIFWALFDQQGSRWTIQAMEMNGYVPYIGVIKPDQIQAMNPILVLILIPIFEAVIYPIFRKLNINLKPLRRMTIGMLLAAVSFLFAGILQLQMESVSTVATQPASGSANFRVMNLVVHPINVMSYTRKFPDSIIVYPGEATEFHPISISLNKALSLFPIKDLHNISSHNVNPINVISFEPNQMDELIENSCYTITVNNNDTQCFLHVSKDDITGDNGFSKVRIFISNYTSNQTLDQNNSNHLVNYSLQFIKIGKDNITIDPMSYADKYFKFKPGASNIEVNRNIIMGNQVKLSDGGVYTLIISYDEKNMPTKYFLFNDVEPRPTNILWQIPQYIIITCGEIMFSITGLDFAYKEAPESMKSCVMAAWLITVSLGNLFVVILGKMVITDNMAIEFFAFGSLLVLTSFIFAIMAYHYRPYADTLNDSEEETVVL